MKLTGINIIKDYTRLNNYKYNFFKQIITVRMQTKKYKNEMLP
jgi:hypothetical protein